MKLISRLFVFGLVVLSTWTQAAPKALSFYLPDEQYNPDIPTPESILGYQVGEWHVRPDQILNYFHALDAASDRVSINVIGQSHQRRDLLQVVITSEQNHKKLSDIQTAHIKRLSAADKPNHDKHPLVVNLNYSVHGDEPSGSNASLLVAYYLAASNSSEVTAYLDNMVILLDPSLNPDGLARFAQWANQHKGMNLNSDPEHREHVQDWIRGRVNHYWFDLNRDWLLLQHPESRARITQYHQWRPNVLTDNHEMGTNSTFFFQPGIPSRKNPYTPEKNVELTGVLAQYHADAFDKENKLYFTEESFDDFYAGKGSTYPDLHGTIGILFEQASSRGHLQDSINGQLDFPTTIKNQVTVSLSTLQGSLSNKNTLLDYQWRFAQSYKSLAKDADHVGYVLTEKNDKSRFHALLSLLKAHDIQSYPLSRDTEIEDVVFAKEHSVFVPLAQPQIRLIQSIFSEQTSFFDNTFYDVSTWNLAMAFNVEYAVVESSRSVRAEKTPWQKPKSELTTLTANAYSYAINWADYNAPALVYELLKNDIQVRSALKEFAVQTQGDMQTFNPGTMLVHAGLQTGNWFKRFEKIVAKYDIEVSPIFSGLTANGIDLGSRNMMPVTLPKVLLIGGFGTNPYEAGETWYLLDRAVGFSPTIIEKDRVRKTDLSKYSHILLVDGNYGKDDKALLEQLQGWVKDGGVLWSQKSAALWLAENELIKGSVIDAQTMKRNFETEGLSYADRESLSGKQRIAGAFFETDLDLSHPLAFGFSNAKLPVFKNNIGLLADVDKPFIQVARYSKEPLIAGYADENNVEQVAEQSAVLAHRHGKGVVIGMTDNPNFRAITYGTNRLLFNALFLANGIR